MKYKYCAATRKGAHDKNEDCIFIDGTVLNQGCISGTVDDGFFAVVCDGVGGEAGGDIASCCAAKSFENIGCNKSDVIFVHEYLGYINDTVRAEQKKTREFRNMSTTIAGITIDEGRFISFNIGDSRAYKFEEGKLERISKDHTLAQYRCDWNEIKETSEATISEQSTLTRYIGGSGLTVKPFVKCGRVNETECVFVICSDGIYKTISDDLMSKVLELDLDLIEKEKAILLHAAKNGLDDMSLVMIEKAA